MHSAAFAFNVASGMPPRSTGKQRDTESSNDYFGARYYNSATGRWLSPDWSSRPAAVPYADLSNPQTLNLYEYVNNNPLSKADADGHCPPCVVAAVVIIGVAAVVAGHELYETWKNFLHQADETQKSNTKLVDQIMDNTGNVDPDKAIKDNQQENIKAMQAGAEAGIAGVAAADAAVTAGEAAVDGPVEALTNPSNAADTVNDSVTDSLNQTNETQEQQNLPDAPTPQPNSGSTSQPPPDPSQTTAPN